jgi:hypothetical protein
VIRWNTCARLLNSDDCICPAKVKTQTHRIIDEEMPMI